MPFKFLICALAICSTTPARAAGPAPVEVMIVGTYHMSNPSRDLHNMKADDVLAPKRQAQLAAIATALAKFHPTQVAVEWDAPVVAERYPKYLAGTLPQSPNEVVQLGFRLAKAAGSAPVHGIDVEGEFPYEPVKAYADAHGMTGLLNAQGAAVDRAIAEREHILATKGIAATLRSMNDPARIKADHDFYRNMLRIGGGAEQPGADLLAAWYRRNFLICANLIQLARPGDRIVVFYGAGHAYLLRQCVAETPGMKLVEANAWLPK